MMNRTGQAMAAMPGARAVSKWTAEEILVVANLGHSLAEQGCDEEAIVIFEGMMALGEITGHFHATLGGLWLRRGELKQALAHLNTALTIDPADCPSLLNRGEALLLLKRPADAIRDLRAFLSLSGLATGKQVTADHLWHFEARARYLLNQIDRQSGGL